jgi:hypothetical protein
LCKRCPDAKLGAEAQRVETVNNAETAVTKWFVAMTIVWTLVALAIALFAARAAAVVIVPIAAVLWYAAHAERVKQSTQLVLPVLLLPGALMCFVGVMQAVGYGRMSDDSIAAYAWQRAAFFGLGLLLHFAAFWLLANESRASDHLSGERATKI